MSALSISNRQRALPIQTTFLRKVVNDLLNSRLALDNYDLGIFLVGDARMIEVNEGHLNHSGVTDVITFNYGEPGRPTEVSGEVFVCVPEAERQARRYQVSTGQEIVRYIIHAILHLQGYDDHVPAERRLMKKAENALVRRLAMEFDLHRIIRGRAKAPLPARNRRRA